MRRRVAILVLLGLCMPSAFAHRYFVGFADSSIEVQDSKIGYELSLGLVEIASVLPLDTDHNNVITKQEIEAVTPKLQDYIEQHLTVTLAGVPIKPHFGRVELQTHDALGAPVRDSVPLNQEYFNYYLWIEMTYPIPQTGGSLEFRYTVFSETLPAYTCPAKLHHKGNEIAFIFSASKPTYRVRMLSYRQVVWLEVQEFFKLGVFHILTGYDHLLFLLSLLLVSKRGREVVVIVTAFTIAHSVTLSLSALQIYALPSRLTESMIALSIAYVAFENTRKTLIAPRWITTFCFGFIHGFGFASALQEHGLRQSTLVLTLASFNIGVEAGQISVVLVAWPFLRILSKQRWQGRLITAVSTAIIVIALYWFVERAFFPDFPNKTTTDQTPAPPQAPKR